MRDRIPDKDARSIPQEQFKNVVYLLTIFPKCRLSGKKISLWPKNTPIIPNLVDHRGSDVTQVNIEIKVNAYLSTEGHTIVFTGRNNITILLALITNVVNGSLHLPFNQTNSRAWVCSYAFIYSRKLLQNDTRKIQWKNLEFESVCRFYIYIR